ncbi:MAG: acetyl-CoA carboxylase biotin carboxylase subunit [Gammaproteobacteria bacterium]
MFSKVLIANRGEIACRVIATCRRLGIPTAAVYSNPDRSARHRHAADEAVALGGALAAESYLDADKIIAAARATGADAIHPGYGFLSENAAFARRCEAEDIAFIGPSADTIDAMGSKIESKRVMEKAGVPCVPGYHGASQDDTALADEAQRVGFPLLIKASAGGGGRGMRIVRDASGFDDALAGARREALAAFDDDAVLLERFIERPRHIEFQVFGDAHGNVVHLFERECSLQRRYQKIVEESPSPFLDDALRTRMGDAAVAAARAVGYRNAGTVEFIVSPNGEFFFMEMNTRLQVEHPVTELVTGLDLVEWQLRVAAGERLPRAQGDLAQCGHAIEVRIYAENTERDFIPTTGRITRVVFPVDENVRIDTGVASGDEISAYYDPMIAKLCVSAPNRKKAVQRLREALDATAVFGLVTNLPLLRAIVREPAFSDGAVDTGWVEREMDALRVGEPPTAVLAAAATAIDTGWRRNAMTARPTDPGSPWLATQPVELAFSPRGQAEPVWRTRPSSVDAEVLTHGREVQVAQGGGCWELEYRPPFAPRVQVGDDEAHPGAPMPGRVVSVQCEPGQRVSPGQVLLVLEAMKMEYTLQARTHGVVAHIHYKVGDMVDAEVPLVDITPDE